MYAKWHGFSVGLCGKHRTLTVARWQPTASTIEINPGTVHAVLRQLVLRLD